MRIDLFFDFCNRLGGKVDSEEDNLGIDAMFRLGEKIGSDECWVGGFIGDDLRVCMRESRLAQMTRMLLQRTKTSEGPAGMSIETRASVSFWTNILAAVTH